MHSISSEIVDFKDISNITRLQQSYNYIHIKQQLNSKFPNFNEQLRDLKTGQLNFLHTTDTHGWYLGHTNQRQYSSDWGDFISFVSNFKLLVEENDGIPGDLLLIDTGDKHDGNGLSDLTVPNGEISTEIFMNAPYDLITVGNHELYVASVSKYEYDHVVPHYGERFISTNVEYLNDDDEWVTFGNSKFRYFETNVNQFKVFSLSFMFDFHGGNERVRVHSINDVVKEKWFKQLLKEYSSKDVDIVVIFGHLPVSHDWLEMYTLHSALRKHFPSTVIQYFGGHSHIRDFAVIDELSTGLQSGRYCETVGFLSLSNFTDLQPGVDSIDDESGTVKLDRKYIDFNVHSFMHHTNKSSLASFNTLEGLAVSDKLYTHSQDLKLTESYGVVPRNYYMGAADYKNNDPNSLLRFLEDEILVQLEPKVCHENDIQHFENDTNNSRIVIINTGSIRYDLYKGDFNRNSQFVVSPFKNKWMVIPSVPAKIAMQIQPILNSATYILSDDGDAPDLSQLLSPYQRATNSKLLQQLKSPIDSPPKEFNDHQISKLMHILVGPTESQDADSRDKKTRRLSYGYKTIDDLGSDGDDSIHKPLPYFPVPNVIQSYENPINFVESLEEEEETEFVDVVFYDFIQPYILWATKIACEDNMKLYKDAVASIRFYNDCEEEFNIGELLKKYAVDNWS
ncbi:hypothetical protein CANARDRAFT_26625 [[Candida] arabinofermentans NRRL YB-2248]|uniref:Calcineurin-like phosphoesterase domain-containing protein n=1 Tax=[Candida] arabinofermentans NRRL YB-2248 TaxID=983967 RepID=A0A1E4T615_9ASCO|nr:hypothetical protein CANARDRAFT_26625 [[Candida] arabinofermentans NRRL YB-2248]